MIALKYICPSCQTPVKASKPLPAGAVKCPKCSKFVVFRRASSGEEEILVFDVEIVDSVDSYGVTRQSKRTPAFDESAKRKKSRREDEEEDEEREEIPAPRLPSWLWKVGLGAALLVLLAYGIVLLVSL
jgi:DNA-directed RNA polymerase subunit RPC12/RpoP